MPDFLSEEVDFLLDELDEELDFEEDFVVVVFVEDDDVEDFELLELLELLEEVETFFLDVELASASLSSLSGASSNLVSIMLAAATSASSVLRPATLDVNENPLTVASSANADIQTTDVIAIAATKRLNRIFVLF